MSQLQLASPSGTEGRKEGDWPMAFDTSTTGGSVPTPTGRKCLSRKSVENRADTTETEGVKQKEFHECQS